MEKPFLFKLRLWHGDPYEYILVYECDEESARVKAAPYFVYNSGKKAKPNDLLLVTIF